MTLRRIQPCARGEHAPLQRGLGGGQQRAVRAALRIAGDVAPRPAQALLLRDDEHRHAAVGFGVRALVFMKPTGVAP